MGEIWGLVASKLANLLFMWAMIQRYCPYQLHAFIERFTEKLANLFYPFVEVKFFEYKGDNMQINQAFSAIEHYLTSKSTNQVKKLQGEFLRKSLVLKIDEHEEVYDEFQGIKFTWSLRKIVSNSKSMSFYPAEDKKYYLLMFHGRYRDFVTKSYLKHVLDEGKNIGLSKRQRKLYTNCTCGTSEYDKRGKWSNVIFEHPASFETLAMDPKKKKEIVDDLITFSKAKEYYARIGKPWKRGYLLFGPPGTGKSTLVAAIANFLKYDIYDIELTNVHTNAELRKLLIGITSKSVVVIEDIDCSLDLTGQRKTIANSESFKGNEEEEKNLINSVKEKLEGSVGSENKTSKVTLSGLLNFIDGIWSASTGERLIIFTTNYVEKLDEALIRRGRMDMHIELSYCGFEEFKVLVKNYLSLESHPLFDAIGYLLDETNMTPADVAENLMPKVGNENVEESLKRLIQALERSKEEVKMENEEEKETIESKESNEEDLSEDELKDAEQD